MEANVKNGKIRSIGLSNASMPVLVDLLAGCEIKPAVNQIEVHPYLQQNEVINVHRKFNIFIQAYAAICRGQPSENKMFSNLEFNALTDPVLVAIAEKQKRSVAQVCLNWAIARKTIPLIKTTNMDRLTENFNCFDFELSSEDLEKISSLNANMRLFDFKFAPAYWN